MIYLIGSLRNPQVPLVAEALRRVGHDVHDDWYAPGPQADDCWQAYEEQRGRSFAEALRGHAARHVFSEDRRWLDRCDTGVLMLPAGRSCHLELGYLIGRGKRGYVLLDRDKPSPERWDVMYGFADGVFNTLTALVLAL